MSSAALDLVPTQPRSFEPRTEPRDLGERLVARGVLAAGDLIKARARLTRQDARLSDVLLAERMVSEADLAATLALHWQVEHADLVATPPDVRLIDALGPEVCLRFGLLPWRRAGSETVVATSRPQDFEEQRARLTEALGPVRFAVASEQVIHEALKRLRQRHLARAAETRVDAEESCRGAFGLRLAWIILALTGVAAAYAVLAPVATLWAMTGWAVVSLVFSSALKAVAAVASANRPPPTARNQLTSIAPSPTVSLLVPLFSESAIAGRLIQRLSRLDYPRELLDICLVVEEDDSITQDAVAATRLPPWMRQIVVPRGTPQTKPRALNYALGFCRGSIVGVYDAEDEPDPGQIHAVVESFDQSGPEVACLQGVLGFYNADRNWITRCFAIEYATWFRVVLPGFARLGLVVPLGGTTLFFRRNILEKLGAWDAHNVTEDADLGVRLSRHGYRTELLTTQTLEEATCEPWRWIKQRSRWLKGYAMTYAVHMRAPRRLWRELGAMRFLGVQIVFLGTLSQFVLAPVLWSFWLFTFGLPHFAAHLPTGLAILFAVLFGASEAISLATSGLAVWRPGHRRLLPWIVLQHVYFTLGTVAVYKALWEAVSAPYFWDKTEHGHSLLRATGVATPGRRIPAPPRRA